MATYDETYSTAIAHLDSWIAEFGGTDSWAIDAAWYAREREAISAESTSIPPTRALSAIACLSGNQGWAGNRTAFRKLAAAYEAGLVAVDMPESDLRDLHIGLVVNVRKAIACLFNDDGLSTGENARKMKSFQCNLWGCTHDGPRCVTVDRWARCAAMGHRHMTEAKPGRNSCAVVPEGEEYRAIADAYRAVADKYGMTPDGLQAAVWCIVAGYRKLPGITFGIEAE